MWYPLTNPIPMVLWCYGGVSALYKVQNEVIWDSPTISSNRWRCHKQKRLEVVWRTEIHLKSPTEFGRQSTKNPLGLVLQAHLWDSQRPEAKGRDVVKSPIHDHELVEAQWTFLKPFLLGDVGAVFAVLLGVSATDDSQMTQVTSTILLVKSATCGKTPIVLP